MELRSGKKLPPVPNFGKNLVQELSQSKNRSSPNPESPVRLSQNQNPGRASRKDQARREERRSIESWSLESSFFFQAFT